MENESAWNVTHLDSEEEAYYDFNHSITCAAGEGKSLRIWVDGLASSNFMIWQPVVLKDSTVYLISGAFKDLNPALDSNFWCEILIGPEQPQDGVDYPSYRILSLNFWNGCGDNLDGTFEDNYCNGSGPRYVRSDTLGDTATYYFCVNAGMWYDPSFQYPHAWDIAVDEISLIDSAAAAEKVVEAIANRYALLNVYANASRQTATITYKVPSLCNVNLTVYNILGQKVETLVHTKRDKGVYNIEYNTSCLAKSIYIFRLEMNNTVITKKVYLH